MFPKGFIFGFSQAGFQSEMGLSDKDENSDWYIWANDQYNTKQGLVSGDDPSNGAAYWDLYETDHAIAKSINMNGARIGIEWSRIFPKSTESVAVSVEENKGDILKIGISEENLVQLKKLANAGAVNHYKDIFLDLRKKGFHTILNLFHWALPKWINDPSKRSHHPGNTIQNCFDGRTVVEFTKFAAFIASEFKDIVDEFCTMNEPNEVFKTCSEDKTVPSFHIRMKYFVEAHARAYDAIKSIANKEVGVIYANGDIQSFENKDPGIKEIVEYEQRYSFFDALVHGDVSWYVRAREARKLDHGASLREDLKGRIDWIGVNYYSRNVVRRTKNGYENVKGLGYDTGWISMEKSLDGRSVSDTGWEIYPEGIYNVLMSYHNRYGLPMMITENGLADVNDVYRPRYIVSHLSYLEKAIEEGANVRGYYTWALCDNFEWGSGYSKRFGFIMVDYETKKRYIRPSALVFREIAGANAIPESLSWMIQEKF